MKSLWIRPTAAAFTAANESVGKTICLLSFPSRPDAHDRDAEFDVYGEEWATSLVSDLQ